MGTSWECFQCDVGRPCSTLERRSVTGLRLIEFFPKKGRERLSSEDEALSPINAAGSLWTRVQWMGKEWARSVHWFMSTISTPQPPAKRAGFCHSTDPCQTMS